jgi:hypothetical protein
MITQTIKRWLNNLFAWWPWKHTTTTSYMPPSRNGTMGIPQEQLWRASDDGSLPQAGATSVAVEQGSNDATPETNLPLRPSSVEHIDTVTQPLPIKDTSTPPLDDKTPENAKLSEIPPDKEIKPTEEQQMGFLRYLISRGLLNEGFDEGKTPEQYRKK